MSHEEASRADVKLIVGVWFASLILPWVPFIAWHIYVWAATH